MSFFNTIRRDFGNNYVKEMKKSIKINRKLAALLNRRNFLLACRRQKLFPTHIIQGIKNIHILLADSRGTLQNKINNLHHNIKSSILNYEISITIQKINNTSNYKYEIDQNIKNNIHPSIYTNFINRQKISNQKFYNKIKRNNIRKFINLTTINNKKNNIKIKDNWVYNLTNETIPDNILKFIALGPKFSLQPSSKNLSIYQIITEVEDILKLITVNTNQKRAKIINILTNYFNSNQDDNYLQKIYLLTKKYLKNHPEIYLIKADKSECSVLINKTDFNNKLNTILNNENDYTILNKNPTNKLTILINKKIKNLVENNHMTEQLGKTLKTYDASTPKLFAKIKIHKQNYPLRHIIESNDSPLQKVTEHLTKILTDSYDKNNSYYVNNSFDLVDEISNMQLPDNYVLISLDVISLFPSLPWELIKLAIEENWETITTYTDIPLLQFLDLLEIIYTNCYFSCNEHIYLQLFGLPMGSCISPILAQYIMDKLTKVTLNKFNFIIPFCKRYVDDYLLAVPKNKTQHVLETFNNYNNHIKFTIELENSAKGVPFLDTLIIRDTNNKIITNWYTKPSFTARYLNYYSYYPLRYKINLITNLRNRVNKLSNSEFHNTNLKKLYNIFIDNSYPPTLINKILYNNETTQRQQNLNVDNNLNIQITYKSLSYINKVTPILKNILQNDNIRISEKATLKLNNLFTNIKEKTQILNTKNTIYKIPCSCERNYIGMSAQALRKRITQHRSNISIRPEACALAKHCFMTSHTPKFADVQILAKETSLYRRTILEMLFIAQENNPINYKLDIKSLNMAYAHLLTLQPSHPT